MATAKYEVQALTEQFHANLPEGFLHISKALYLSRFSA